MILYYGQSNSNKYSAQKQSNMLHARMQMAMYPSSAYFCALAKYIET